MKTAAKRIDDIKIYLVIPRRWTQNIHNISFLYCIVFEMLLYSFPLKFLQTKFEP